MNVGFLIVLFPQPVPLLFAATWFYAILKWREKFKEPAFIQGALILLPMLLRHNARELEFWGLSYVTFRVFHLFIDRAVIKELTFPKFFTFAFYFPSLLAGPVDRTRSPQQMPRGRFR
jgi:D-alanyl-lipoteichoic acid acyltransferase DltB (MBOAT superfamily)